jgi:hypothetical protein
MPVSISGVTLGDPIVITSGTLNVPIDPVRYLKVDRVYWLQPTLDSTSSLVICKGNQLTTSSQIYVEAKCEISGQSQLLNLGDNWWEKPFISCMPTGKLYIYLQ